ncbi:hypothetical protein [Hydrogenophaga sp.]|uniref:hypothetical protein n=1 Tax=Hydrogenophaga sp. TaxID=1904254 RepID=UPI003D09A0D4
MNAMGDDVAWWAVLALVGGAGASLLGLSMLLRSRHELTRRAVIGAVLHSMMWGVVIFLMSYSTLKDDLPMLLGLSIMSGLGTASAADMLLMLLKSKFGINVTINPKRKDGSQTQPTPLE